MRNHRRLLASSRKAALSEQGANDGKNAENAKPKKGRPSGIAAAHPARFGGKESRAHPDAASNGTRRLRRDDAAR